MTTSDHQRSGYRIRVSTGLLTNSRKLHRKNIVGSTDRLHHVMQVMISLFLSKLICALLFSSSAEALTLRMGELAADVMYGLTGRLVCS